jgi:hypothetical protein
MNLTNEVTNFEFPILNYQNDQKLDLLDKKLTCLKDIQLKLEETNKKIESIESNIREINEKFEVLFADTSQLN